MLLYKDFLNLNNILILEINFRKLIIVAKIVVSYSKIMIYI